MKNRLKKVLCVLLSIVILSGSLSAIACASAVNDLPVVFIEDRQKVIYLNGADESSKQLSTVSLSEDTEKALAKALPGTMLKGLSTGQWQDFSNTLVDILVSEFSPFALDENGERFNESGYDFLINREVTGDKNLSEYYLHGFTFFYDWRLDPFYNAEQLNGYIEKIKEITGKNQVKLVSEGMGTYVALTYFHEYGYSDVNEFLMLASGLDGIDGVGAAFSGNFILDTELVNTYFEQSDSSGNIISSLLRLVVDFTYMIQILDTPVDLINKIYGLVYKDVLPRVLTESFATFPGYWAAVNDDYYEDAKALLFLPAEQETDMTDEPGQEKEDEEQIALTEELTPLSEKTEDAEPENINEEEIENIEEPAEPVKTFEGLKLKIDRYHEEIYKNIKNIINTAVENGVHVYNIVKYGKSMLPVSANCDTQSDGILSLYSASLGAGCVPVGQHYDEEFMTNAYKTGRSLFISPDEQVDASTCVLPVHTWFIKNAEHDKQAAVIDDLIAEILNNNGYTTVFQLADHPQFLVVNKAVNRMEPMNETGVITPTKEEEIEDYFTFDGIFDFLIKIFSTVAMINHYLRMFIDQMTSIKDWV